MRKIVVFLLLSFTGLFLAPTNLYALGPGAGGPAQGISIPEISAGCSVNQVNSAIGCIPLDDTTALAGFFFRWAIGIGGGLAFLLIVYSGYIIITSTGDPKRLQGGQELLTSAIGGLIILIFAVFILRLMGVDILKVF